MATMESMLGYEFGLHDLKTDLISVGMLVTNSLFQMASCSLLHSRFIITIDLSGPAFQETANITLHQIRIVMGSKLDDLFLHGLVNLR